MLFVKYKSATVCIMLFVSTKSATINMDRREYLVIVVVMCISYALKSSMAIYSHNGGYVFGSSVCHLANAPFFLCSDNIVCTFYLVIAVFMFFFMLDMY